MLRNINYIHADFKAGALFVNINTQQCAIIDFDSGAIMESKNDKPTTWGESQDWLAPEIMEQIAKKNSQNNIATDPNARTQVKVDLLSDMWSVAVAIHYIVFTMHPFSFFSEISFNSIAAYEKSKEKFPNSPYGFKYLTTKSTQKRIYNQVYLPLYNKNLPQNLKEKFSTTFTYGGLNPQKRPPYAQWKIILGQSQKSPRIHSFQASKVTLTDNTPVIFTWRVDNATELFLDNINVTGKNNYQLSIKQDQVVKLVAKNASKQTSKAIKITVSKAKPSIRKFTSNKPNNFIKEEGTFVLSWDVVGYEKLEITDLGDVSNLNKITINSPKQDTVLVLTATSFFGAVNKKQIKLTVDKQAPTILGFKSSHAFAIDKNTPVILSWNIIGAKEIFIDNGIGSVTGNMSKEVNPRKDTIYTITAVSYFGIASSQKIKIEVPKLPPQIKSFSADKALIYKEENIQLYWDIEGAEEMYINQGIGEVSNQNNISVRLVSETTFTITAISYFGAKSTSFVTVQTSKAPPRIKNFSASTYIVENTKPITLYWEAERAKNIQIDTGIGEVTSLRKASFFVTKDTTLTLTATSFFGVSISRTIKIQVSKIPPKIISFRAKSILLFEGGSTKLSWQVEKAHSVEIDNGIGLTTSIGDKTIAPKTDTTYTLIAKNFFGYESRSHVYVKFLRKPVLNVGSVQLKTLPKLKRTKTILK